MKEIRYTHNGPVTTVVDYGPPDHSQYIQEQPTTLMQRAKQAAMDYVGMTVNGHTVSNRTSTRVNHSFSDTALPTSRKLNHNSPKGD